MHCPACGSEAKESARFCTQCGASLEGGSRDAVAKDDTTSKEGSTVRIPLVENVKTSFKEALDASKRKSRRRMPVLLLVVLGMFLSATLAWAAYNVLFGAQQAGEEEVVRIEEPEPARIDLGEFVGPVREERQPIVSQAPAPAPEPAPVEPEPEQPLVDLEMISRQEIPIEDIPTDEGADRYYPTGPDARYSGWILATSSGFSSADSMAPHEEFFYDLTQEEINEKVRRYEEQGYEVTYGFF